MQTLANPKKKLTKTIIITLMFLLVPMTAFASASPTYMAGIENVCDLTLTDSQNNIYDEQDIEDFGQGNYGHYTRVIVEPSVYSLNIDCVSNLNSGEISVDLISVLDQDGINNFNPNDDWNTIQSSTFFVSSAAATMTLDATGAISNQLLVKWEIDAEDNNGDLIELEGLLGVVPMNDTTNDTTPRISLWPGKVNQHNDNGVWMTDSDGVSGGGSHAQWGSEGYGDRKLEYCQKFWPNTDSVELRTFKEEITFWTRGNANAYTSIRDVYECVLGDDPVDNDTEPCVCNGTIAYALIEEQWATFDHKISIKTEGLNIGGDYELDWVLMDEINQVMISSGADTWTATQSIHYTYDLNLDLPAGTYCVYAELFESGNLADTKDNCITIANESAYIAYTLIEEQWGTFDHKISIKTAGLNDGLNYDLDWILMDDVNQVMISSGTDTWTPTQSTHYTYDLNLDLPAGTYCVYAQLFESTISVDTKDNCITITNDAAYIAYALIEEQWGTFEHKISVKTASLDSGLTYDLNWELMDDVNQVMISSGTESWTATQSTHYTYELNLDLPAGTYCVYAELFESGNLADAKDNCITIECDGSPELPGDNNTGGLDNDTGGDNNTGEDNNTGGLDNNTGGDNNTGEDNNTGGDNDTIDEDEQPYLPPTLEVELDVTNTSTLAYLTASNLDSSKDYTIEWMIVSTDTFDVVSGSEGIENSSASQITDTWVVTDEIILESGEYCIAGALYEDGIIIEAEVVDCQTVLTPEVDEDDEVEAGIAEKIVSVISDIICGLFASFTESKDE